MSVYVYVFFKKNYCSFLFYDSSQSRRKNVEGIYAETIERKKEERQAT